MRKLIYTQHGWFRILAFVIFFTSGLLIVLLIFWSLQPFRPVLDITNMKVQDKIVAGEPVLLEYDYCKHQDTLSGSITRYFKDTVIVYLPNIQSNVQKGCGHVIQQIDTPKNMSPDKYTLNFEISYKINPIVDKTYYFKTPKFQVIKGGI
ncbi:MAG TPA: hypothetical protein PKC05_02685 [Candidatus Saccharibacteria bacterium]|nr:hypothetical protein [Candidatus Saccharibacteria bacterium]